MMKAYKFRLYPTEEQKKALETNFSAVRFVYNYYLALRKEMYETNKETMGFNAMCKHLTDLKKEPETAWLQEADSCALQHAVRNLDTAYKNFFRRVKNGETPGFPKFKSRHNHNDSYKFTSARIAGEKYIRLGKVGFVECRFSQPVEGRILSATVSRNPSGKYFVSLGCGDVEIPHKEPTGAVVGLLIGGDAFVTTSDGVMIPAMQIMKEQADKIAKLQRSLSRKEKGSANYEKARVKLARAHEKISNQRQDFLNKLSTDLVRQYDVIAVNEQKIRDQMQDDHEYAKEALDMCQFEFVRQLQYKSAWYGSALVFVKEDQVPTEGSDKEKAEAILRVGLRMESEE